MAGIVLAVASQSVREGSLRVIWWGDLKAGKEEGRRSEVLFVVADTRTEIQTRPCHSRTCETGTA